MEMPPLTPMVLDGLADDMESIESLRDHGEAAPFGLALVDEQDVVDALRALLEVRMVEAWEVAEPQLQLVPAPNPLTDDASLRRYLFQWTRVSACGATAAMCSISNWDASAPGG